MGEEKYYPRLIDRKVDEYLKAFGAVSVEGPKYCGKTFTSLYHSKSSFYLADYSGNWNNKKLAQMSPDLVLQGEKPRLIDEWQEVPGIWDAVRFAVDREKSKGLYILTGSAGVNPASISHSGAGRIARIKMATMSLFEMGASSGVVSVNDIFSGRFDSKMTGEVHLTDIIDFIVRGGWPENINEELSRARLLPRNYINSLLEYDIFKLDDKKRDRRRMNLLLRSLARNESTTVSLNSLKKDLSGKDNTPMDDETISDYLSILDRLYLIENQKPSGMGIRSSVRIKQMEKRHFTDPSFAVSILGLTPDSFLKDLETLGFFFEALAERDLRIYAEANDAELFHYQDYKNREIDAVIEYPDGRWAGFEIKLGADQIDAAAKNLCTIRDEFVNDSHAKNPEFLAVISGLSNAAYKRPDGIYVLPLTALKD